MGNATRGKRTVAVCTVRVQFASLVLVRDVDQGEVPDARHLDIVRCLDEMCTTDGTIGNETRAVAGLDAPGDLNLLGVADDRIGTGLWGAKDAPVVYGVDYRTRVDLARCASALCRQWTYCRCFGTLKSG